MSSAVLFTELNIQIMFVLLTTLIAILLAKRHPMVLVTFHIMFSIPSSLIMHGFQNSNQWLVLIPGIRINEIILGAMFIALIIRLGNLALHTLFFKKNFPLSQKGLLAPFIFGFGLWLVFEMIRNFHIYGLSSLGEFRSHYLSLILPLYITVFFDTKKKREQLFRSLIFFCLLLPILCIPVIGAFKGWGMGQQNRFFPANISFGILLGLLSYMVANLQKTIRLPLMIFWPVLLTALLIIIFDSHRSVWFPGLILIPMVFRMTQNKRLNPFKAIGYMTLVLFTLLVATSVATSMLDKELFDFILERGGELFKIDETYHTTWTWRIAKWREQLIRVSVSPLTGLGFGGYWGLSELPGDVGISPHNLYVQILVKLGLVGLGLYLGIIVFLFREISRGLNLLKKVQDPECVFLICGMLALIGGHIYGLAYAFNEYSLMYWGLAMAVIRHRVQENIPNAS